jgi:alkylhydroperoxidase family enzyme
MDYPKLDDLPAELVKIIADKRGVNVYKMLMHTRNVAPGFTAMADAVMWSPKWPATMRELAIVRVGHHYGAPYEIHHHERIGQMVGLSEAKLAACRIGADQFACSPEEQIILCLTDALVTRHTLTSHERKDALEVLDTNGLADFVLTVGFYQAVCNFLNVFEVDIETAGLST